MFPIIGKAPGEGLVLFCAIGIEAISGRVRVGLRCSVFQNVGLSCLAGELWMLVNLTTPQKEMLESLVQSASGMEKKKGTDQLIRVAHQSQIGQGSF